MTVAITGQDLSAADLRQAAARTQEAKVARRMLAIALVLEGCSRTEAAETCAMDRQTLRDWVHRFNASGLDGLSDQPRRNGPLPRLSAEQQAEIEAWVEEGADLKRDGVRRLMEHVVRLRTVLPQIREREKSWPRTLESTQRRVVGAIRHFARTQHAIQRHQWKREIIPRIRQREANASRDRCIANSAKIWVISI